MKPSHEKHVVCAQLDFVTMFLAATAPVAQHASAEYSDHYFVSYFFEMKFPIETQNMLKFYFLKSFNRAQNWEMKCRPFLIIVNRVYVRAYDCN